MPQGEVGIDSVKGRALDGVAAQPLLSKSADAVDMTKLSYSQQYDIIFSKPVDNKSSIPKPSKDAQDKEKGSIIPFTNVKATPKARTYFHHHRDFAVLGFMTFIHGAACLAPWTFSWNMLALFFAMYFVSGCLGITLSYHRMLSHKSFTTYKWFEYTLAYCGMLAVEGDPLEWCSNHRYHHQHTDTPLDPHSAYEGFWHAHMGWLFDNTAIAARVQDRANVDYLRKQFYYRFLEATFPVHIFLQYAALYYFGGIPALVWGGALRQVWVFHITWFVNSATHSWGYRTYHTGDLSRNNWWVGILAFGEGWHNNHHCFEFSARHGLEWYQFDMTYLVIRTLEALGLVWNVQLPSEKQKESKRLKPEAAKAKAA